MLKVSETFQSLQGEGPGGGKLSFFLRLAGCNLHCSWCDTKYTWDWRRYRYDDEVTARAPAELAGEIRGSGRSRLIVTGGEPLLQQAGLAELLALLPPELFVEVETNGTVAPSTPLTQRIDQWNVSPKLASAGDPERVRISTAVLLAFRATERAWLKLVVQTPDDLSQADALIDSLGWPRAQVSLMPEATTRSELQARGRALADAAARRGHRYSSRLHVELWNGRRGT